MSFLTAVPAYTVNMLKFVSTDHQPMLPIDPPVLTPLSMILQSRVKRIDTASTLAPDTYILTVLVIFRPLSLITAFLAE